MIWMSICHGVRLSPRVMRHLSWQKPRPDLVSRCQPDVENVANYLVSGRIKTVYASEQLVYATNCKNLGEELDDCLQDLPLDLLSVSTKIGASFDFLSSQVYCCWC
jgi:hypothetical protein